MKYPEEVDRVLRGLGVPLLVASGVRHGRELRVDVGGDGLWVHSDRDDIVLSPEAIASAFLLPATAKRRRLGGAAIDPVWLSGAPHIQALAADWWGWRAPPPRFRKAATGHPAPGVGLAFSLGVDSFYSLFFADPAPDLLILAGGFDVPVDRRDILAAMSASVAAVAEATGRDWALVETDLRRHRLFRSVGWAESHGGALAFLGHLLRGRIGTLVVSSSYDSDHLGAHGSHPALDSHFSSSSLSILHIGAEVPRVEKLRRLVDHPVARPLVQRHLRVCWERPDIWGNCGHCPKCLLTRLALHRVAGDLRLDTMPEPVPLLAAIEALSPRLDPLNLNFWRELRGCPDPRLDAALNDLIARSEAALGAGR